MVNVEMIKKRHAEGLWTDEMLDALENAGKITKEDNARIKAEVIAEMPEK